VFSVIGVCVVKKKFSTKLRKYKITFSSETWFEIIAYALTLASLRFIIVASHSQLNSSPPFFSTLRLPPLITPSPLHNLHPDHNLQTHLQRQLNRTFKFRSLNPILSTDPPWLFSPSIVNLSLTQYPKSSTPPSSYRTLFQKIINSFTKPTICFTNGSKIHNRSGFAYLIGNFIYSHRHRDSASVYTIELQAICDCLEQILTLPHPSTNNIFIIVSDSLSSLNAISHPSPSHPLISSIHLHLIHVLPLIYLSPSSGHLVMQPSQATRR